MNSRIKDYARVSHLDVYGLGKNKEHWECSLEKFARLIVRDCGDIAYNAYWNNPNAVKGIHIKEQIQQHFGVSNE